MRNTDPRNDRHTALLLILQRQREDRANEPQFAFPQAHRVLHPEPQDRPSWERAGRFEPLP